MASRWTWFALAAASLACTGRDPAKDAPPGVTIWEGADHVTEGDVVVPGDPAAVYAELADYVRWPDVFADVAKITVVSRGEPEDAVTLVTVEGQTNNLRFHDDPTRRVVHFRDTGGRAEVWADIAFEAAGPRATRVHARLYADVPGVVGWFVTNGRLRRERQRKLISDLRSIGAYFSADR